MRTRTGPLQPDPVRARAGRAGRPIGGALEFRIKSKRYRASIGIGLSGGGYRAAIFHLGVLEALDAIQITVNDRPPVSFLHLISNFSTVSGGSLMGAFYVLHHKEKFSDLKQQFIQRLLRLDCERETILKSPVILPPLVAGFITLGLLLVDAVLVFSVGPSRMAFLAGTAWGGTVYLALALLSGFAFIPQAVFAIRFSKFLGTTARKWIFLSAAPVLVLVNAGAWCAPPRWPYFFVGLTIYCGFFLLVGHFFAPFSRKKARFLNRVFDDRTLSDLPKNREIAINAAVMETGASWIFSRDSFYQVEKETGGGDSNGFHKFHEYRIGSAVSASSNFPPVYEPLPLPRRFYAGSSHRHSLTDGGTVDNHGIRQLARDSNRYPDLKSQIILISDSGLPKTTRSSAGLSVISQIRSLISEVLFETVQDLNRALFGSLGANRVLPGVLYIELSQTIDGLITNQFRSARCKSQVHRRLRELAERPGATWPEEGPAFDCYRTYLISDQPIGTNSEGYLALRQLIFDSIGFNAPILEPAAHDRIGSIGTGLSPLPEDLFNDCSAHGLCLAEFLVKFWFLDHDRTTGRFRFREEMLLALAEEQDARGLREFRKIQNQFETGAFEGRTNLEIGRLAGEKLRTFSELKDIIAGFEHNDSE